MENGSAKILSTSELIKQYYQQLEIPDFQRGYVWSTDQWAQLWDDLVQLPENGQHFMGCLTLQPTGAGTYQILDGQQRLTTVMVLLDFLAAQLGQQVCSLGGLFRAAENAHVHYFDTQEQADAVAQGKKPSSPSVEQRRYLHILYYFVKCHSIAGYPDRRQLLKKLEERFFWLVDETDLKDDAHQTFEQLNATGEPLTYADFLLSYLLELRQKSGGDLSDQGIKEQWGILLQTLSTGANFQEASPLFPEDEDTEADTEDVSEEAEGETEASSEAEDGEEMSPAEDTAEAEDSGEVEDAEAEDTGGPSVFRPLKLKKFLNALWGVALVWSRSVPETVENFQKAMEQLARTTERLHSQAPIKIETGPDGILEMLNAWVPIYLALTDPLSKRYKGRCFERERYYFSTLQSAADLPMAMRVLYRLEQRQYSDEEAEAILGAVVRFSLYCRIFPLRSSSGLRNCGRKIAMLDYILDALRAERHFPLTVERVLGVIMGGLSWGDRLPQQQLLAYPYSSSVSKVLLCIAHDQQALEDPQGKLILDLEREGEPFQVEHMVARNLPGGNYSAYGFDVSTIERPANLILLERSLNNSLNNQQPQEKAKATGWGSSCLYGYYDALHTFSLKDGKWEGLCAVQEERMQDLWKRFQDYMGKPEAPDTDKGKEKHPILWGDKDLGELRAIRPAAPSDENAIASRDHVLYALDSDLHLQVEPKKEKQAEAFYFSLGKRVDRVAVGQGGPTQDGEVPVPGTDLRTIASLALTGILMLMQRDSWPMGENLAPDDIWHRVNTGPLYEYVEKISTTGESFPQSVQISCFEKDRVYKMLAVSEVNTTADRLDNIFKNHCRAKANWGKEPLMTDPGRGNIWLNSSFSISDLCMRLRLVYKHFAGPMSFGLWVEVKDPTIQCVGGRLYYVPYINIGDEQLYGQFLQNLDQQSRSQNCSAPAPAKCTGPVPNKARWFRAEQKSLMEVLALDLTIPEYQRRYVWEQRNWEDMKEYLIRNAQKGSIPYGTVILCKGQNGAYSVVDGQQRLTTLLSFCRYAGCSLPRGCGLTERPEILKALQNMQLSDPDLRLCLGKVCFTVLFLEGADLPVTCPYQVFSAINGKGKKLSTAEKMRNLVFSLLERAPVSKNSQKSKAENAQNDKAQIGPCLKDIRFPKAWMEMQGHDHIADDALYGAFKAALSEDPRSGEPRPLEVFFSCGEIFQRHFVNYNHNKETIPPALMTELLFYHALGVTTGDALILSWLTGQDQSNAAKKLRQLNMLYFLLYVMDRSGNDKKSINRKLPQLVGVNERLSICCGGQHLIQDTIQRDEKEIETVWREFVCTYDLGTARREVARFLLLKIENWLGLKNEPGTSTGLDALLRDQNLEVEHIHPISVPDPDLRMNALENICLLEKPINASVRDKPLMDLKNGKGKLKAPENSENSDNPAGENKKADKVYSSSSLIMPRMFYQDGEPRWYGKDGTYGSEEAKARMAAIWQQVRPEFLAQVMDVLP